MPTNAEQGMPSVDDVLDLNPTSFVDDVYNAVRRFAGSRRLNGVDLPNASSTSHPRTTTAWLPACLPG